MEEQQPSNPMKELNFAGMGERRETDPFQTSPPPPTQTPPTQTPFGAEHRSETKSKANNSPSNFLGTPGRGSGFKDFMNSNSVVARISFLLIAVLVFVFALQIGIGMLMSAYNNTGSPHLITGMVDANNQITIAQDPSIPGAQTIARSNNGPNGVEFTWSVWIFINNLSTTPGTYNHVFHKGNNNLNESGMNMPNNAPGLYITTTDKNQAELIVVMNTYQIMNEEIQIPNIPLNKWINVIIRCKNTILDVYINGTMTRSMDLVNVPKQNYGDVYVALNGGFNGYISNLWYYNYALGTSAIQTITKTGPNLKMADSTGGSALNLNNYNFFSLKWYFNQDEPKK